MAEPQTPTGKFTTAGEVKMILETTKLNELFDVREGDLSQLIKIATEE